MEEITERASSLENRANILEKKTINLENIIHDFAYALKTDIISSDQESDEIHTVDILRKMSGFSEPIVPGELDSMRSNNSELSVVAKMLNSYDFDDIYSMEVAAPKILLEVLDCHESKKLMRRFHVGILLGFVIFITGIMTVKFSLKSYEVRVGTDQYETLQLPDFGGFSIMASIVIDSIIFLVCTVSTILYVVHLKLRTTEKFITQIFILFGLILASIYVFPAALIISRIYHSDFQVVSTLYDDEAPQLAMDIYVLFTNALVYSMTYLFLLLTAATFRLVKKDEKPQIGAKIFFVTLYNFAKIFFYFGVGIQMGALPSASIVILGRLATRGVYIHSLQLVCFIFMVLFDFFFIFWVALELKMSSKFLSTKSFMAYRSHQMGYRFFRYTTTVLAVIIYIMDFTRSGLYPIAVAQIEVVNVGRAGLGIDMAGSGINVIFASYILTQAYVQLPADVYSVFNFHRREKDNPEVTERSLKYMIKLRDLEDSHGHIAIHKKLLTGETLIRMLNFSFLTYRHDTPGFPTYYPITFQDTFNVVVNKVMNPDTDIHALVLESSSSISVAFRGTLSQMNIETDINILTEKFTNIFPQYNETHISHIKIVRQIEDAGHSLKLYAARLHRGFAAAYLSVKDDIDVIIDRLMQENERPLFICGHSLGGALATLYTLGYVIEHPNIAAVEKFVSLTTFGSPRVGNSFFADIFDSHVPVAWRVVNAGDVVTKIPSWFYEHVGREILLSAENEFFLEPTFLEEYWLHTRRNSIQSHRVPLYSQRLQDVLKRESGANSVMSFWSLEEASMELAEELGQESLNQDETPVQESAEDLRDTGFA